MNPITEGNLERAGTDPVEIPAKDEQSSFTVTVNNRPVILTSHRVTGLAIKEAAIAQGVQIEPDFLLTLEAFGGQPARTFALPTGVEYDAGARWKTDGRMSVT